MSDIQGHILTPPVERKGRLSFDLRILGNVMQYCVGADGLNFDYLRQHDRVFLAGDFVPEFRDQRAAFVFGLARPIHRQEFPVVGDYLRLKQTDAIGKVQDVDPVSKKIKASVPNGILEWVDHALTEPLTVDEIITIAREEYASGVRGR